MAAKNTEKTQGKTLFCFSLRLGVFTGILLFVCACAGPSDYQAEIARLHALLNSLPDAQNSSAKTVKHIDALYQLALLSGDYDTFQSVETAIKLEEEAVGRALKNDSLTKSATVPALYYLRARLNFTLHRFPQALDDANRLGLKAMVADIALQQGRYDQALQGYENTLKQDRSWHNLARLAYYKMKTGYPKQAEALYLEAQDQLSVKEMRHYAWLELQRGLLDLEYGHYRQALAHYQQADRAWSGYWVIEEHLAEVYGLLGDTDKAAVLYQKVIDKTGSPEFMEALANMLEQRDPAQARVLRQRAEVGYAHRMALYPEATVGHRIKHWLQRAEADPRLLEYAQFNHRLRPNAEAKLLLAQAYIKHGDIALARELLQEIVQSPWRTPEITRLAEQINQPGMAGTR